jgi:hypothetical protein
MKTKSARILKVEATGDFFRRDIRPLIRLRGQWLARHGFLPEGHVVIEPVAPGELRLSYRPAARKAGGSRMR